MDFKQSECFHNRREDEVMAYEWDPGRARRAQVLRIALVVALAASVISVPLAVLLAAASPL